MPEYGNDIYETGVVLEPIRPPLDGHPVYYDEEEYVFQDYNDIPLVPPTPEPTLRREQNRQVSSSFSLDKYSCTYFRRTLPISNKKDLTH